MNSIDGAAIGALTTEDNFLGDKLKIRQPRHGYRAGTDAVLLAATVNSADTSAGPVLDVGAGVGVVGLCVASRCPQSRVVLIEREHYLATLAAENAVINRVADRVKVVTGDILHATEPLMSAGVQSESFALVLANPPFHDEVRNSVAINELRARSHAMPDGALDDWARFMCRMAYPGGRAVMIHKAEALPRILTAFEGRFGGITITPIHSRKRDPAIRIIVEGIKGSRAPLTIKPEVVLHGSGQEFAPEIDAIFRQGAALMR